MCSYISVSFCFVLFHFNDILIYYRGLQWLKNVAIEVMMMTKENIAMLARINKSNRAISPSMNSPKNKTFYHIMSSSLYQKPLTFTVITVQVQIAFYAFYGVRIRGLDTFVQSLVQYFGWLWM